VDGIFLETHDNPSAALSDGPNALPLAQTAFAAQALEAGCGAGAKLGYAMSLDCARRVPAD